MELRRVALGNVGALAVRASNVAVLLLESGYGIEALAPGRRLLEHQLRAKELYEDETGNAAQRWLAHKKATPMSSLIKANPGAGRLHGVMSRMAHDDRRAIETLSPRRPGLARQAKSERLICSRNRWPRRL